MVIFAILVMFWFVMLAAYAGLFLLKAKWLVEDYKKEHGEMSTLRAFMESPEVGELCIKAITPPGWPTC